MFFGAYEWTRARENAFSELPERMRTHIRETLSDDRVACATRPGFYPDASSRTDPNEASEICALFERYYHYHGGAADSDSFAREKFVPPHVRTRVLALDNVRCPTGRSDPLAWTDMTSRRQGRFARVTPEDAARIYDGRRRAAAAALLDRDSSALTRDSSALTRDSSALTREELDELEMVGRDACEDPDGWAERTIDGHTFSRRDVSNNNNNNSDEFGRNNNSDETRRNNNSFENGRIRRRPRVPGERLHEDGKRCLLLGMLSDIDRYEIDRSKYMIRPWSRIGLVAGSAELSWNVLANAAAIACALANSKGVFPLQFVLPAGWQKDVSVDRLDRSRFGSSAYVGFLVLSFDHLSDFRGSADYQHFTNRSSAACNAVILGVFRNGIARSSEDVSYAPWTLFNLFGEMVEWGDFARRKRVTYHEARQLLAHMSRDPDGDVLRLYRFHAREDDVEMWVVRKMGNNSSSHREFVPLPGRADDYRYCCGEDDDDDAIVLTRSKLEWNEAAGGIVAVDFSKKSSPDVRVNPIADMDVRAMKKWYFFGEGGVGVGGVGVGVPARVGISERVGVPAKKTERELKWSVRYRTLLGAAKERGDPATQHDPSAETLINSSRKPGVRPVHSSSASSTDVFYPQNRSPMMRRMLEMVLPPPSQSSPIAIAAPNGVFAEMAACDIGVPVDLFLYASKNVAPIEALVSKSRNVRIFYPGLYFTRKIAGGAPSSSSLLIVDMMSTWSPPQAAAMLLGARKALLPSLADGGTALLFVTLPMTSDGMVMRAIERWTRCFDAYEIVPNVSPNVKRYATAFVVLRGRRRLAIEEDGESNRLLDALLYESQEYPTTAVDDNDKTKKKTSNSNNRKLADAVNSAYKRLCEHHFSNVPDAAAAAAAKSENDFMKSTHVPLYFRASFAVEDMQREVDGRFPYVDADRDLEPRCHWGQLKLLLSEWEFLNATRDVWKTLATTNTRRAVVIYAGAANGAHIPFLADLFPEIKTFFLFDGAPFDRGVVEHPRIKTFREFVTDATVPKFKRLAQGAPILFISDIRVRPSEEDVRSDMLAQARWGVAMDAEAMLLKFRPPYPVGPQKRASVPSAVPEDFPPECRRGGGHRIVGDKNNLHSYDANSTNDRVPAARRMLYLDGAVQPQLFAPMNSTEARLYVRKPYRLKYYDVLAHEESMYFYNISTRRLSAVSTPSGLPLDSYLPGFDLGWESQQAFRIALEHSRSQRDDDDTTLRALRTLATALLELRKTTQRCLATCVSETYEKYAAKKPGAREKVSLWLSLVRANEEEMSEIQRRRMASRAVRDGVYASAEDARRFSC